MSESTGRRRALATALVALLVVALGVLGQQAWTRWIDGPSDAQAGRDSALSASSDALAAMLTADHRSSGETLETWSSVSVGRLRQGIARDHKRLLRQLQTNRVISTATVRDAALSSWDGEAGVARLVAVVDIRSSARGKKARHRTVSYLAMAQRRDGHWKLAAMQQIGANR